MTVINSEHGHYRAFVDTVDSGIFEGEEIGAYLEDIKNRALYIKSPIQSDSTIAAFGGEEKFGKCVDSYIQKGIANGKALPFDNLLCVEDDFSAVFIENSPENERAMRVTTFQDTRINEDIPYSSVIYSGDLVLVGSDLRTNSFAVADLYVALVSENNVEILSDLQELKTMMAGIDLINTTSTVLEELAYMDKKGLFPITPDKQLIMSFILPKTAYLN